jgi:HEAT repeat protein
LNGGEFKVIKWFAIPSAVVVMSLSLRPPAQDTLDRRIASSPNGTVSFTFPARPGVCGDGQTFIAERHDRAGGYSTYLAQGVNISGWPGTDFTTRCLDGPVRVVVDVRNGAAVAIRPYVGPSPRGSARTNLGQVTVPEATAYLLRVARRSEELASPAMLAAYLGDDSQITTTLFEFARDPNLDGDVRETALKYIGRAAEREGTTPRALGVARGVMLSSDPIQLRERAVRVLGELPGGDAIVRTSYNSLTDFTLKERAIRVVAEAGGAQNARWIQSIALDESQPVEVRERAIRVLADELGQLEQVRSMYSRVSDDRLRERIVRVMGDEGSATDLRWLRTVAENRAEAENIRERAIRTLGDQGQLAELRVMFDRLQEHSLRERIVRLVAEHGSREDHIWLEQLVTDDAMDAALRERAVRSLFDAGITTRRLISLYDRADDTMVRERIIRLLGERGDDASIEKLLDISRNAREQSLRERAVKAIAQKAAR